MLDDEGAPLCASASCLSCEDRGCGVDDLVVDGLLRVREGFPVDDEEPHIACACAVSWEPYGCWRWDLLLWLCSVLSERLRCSPSCSWSLFAARVIRCSVIDIARPNSPFAWVAVVAVGETLCSSLSPCRPFGICTFIAGANSAMTSLRLAWSVAAESCNAVLRCTCSGGGGGHWDHIPPAKRNTRNVTLGT